MSSSLQPNLPGITQINRPLRGHSAQRLIHFQGKEKVSLLLLPDGMFCLLSHHMAQRHIADVVVTLGQIIVAHVANGPDSTGEENIRRDLIQLEADSAITGPMTWADLPGAFVTYFKAPESTIYCGLRVGRQAAIFVFTRDPEMIFSWARFSTATPDRARLLAFGRIVISNTQVVRSGTSGR